MDAPARKPLASIIRLRHLQSPPDLANLCECIVEREDAGKLGVAIDFPDARPLLQVVLGHDCRVRNQGSGDAFKLAPHAGLWGPSGRVKEVALDGRMHIICAVLTLQGAARLTRTPVGSFADQRVELDSFGLNGHDLRARLAGARSFDERAHVMLDWLRTAFASRRELQRRPEYDMLACGQLYGSVAQIADQLGVTPRGLHKRTMRDIGWSPSKLTRIARLQASLRYSHPKPWSPYLAESLLLQFHDRAHFTKEFQLLTGMTPGIYRRAKEQSGDCLVNTLYVDASAVRETSAG